MTGSEWNKTEFEFVVVNPKAWIGEEWTTEEITKEEFLQRALKSVVQFRD